MSKRKEKTQIKKAEKLSEVFVRVSEPIMYELSVFSNKGERWRVINWGDYPRLTVSTYTPRGFTNILNIRLTVEGIEKGIKRLTNALKLLQQIQKLASEGKITLAKETQEKIEGEVDIEKLL